MNIILNVLVSAIAVLVILTSVLVPGFHVASWWWALGFAFVLSIINSAFHSLTKV